MLHAVILQALEDYGPFEEGSLQIISFYRTTIFLLS